MKLSRIIVALLILVGSYFLYQNYQDQKDYSKAEAVYSTKVNSLNPLDQPFHNTRLTLIYESLLHVDANLQFQPQLAVSFGQIDDTTWQFTLKDNVKFHNQESLTSEKVVENFTKYSANTINTLKSVEVSAENPKQIIFKLNQIDPLFLQKISEVPILFTNQNLEIEAIGTGPYQLDSYSPSLIRLDKFTGYHSSQGIFENITLSTINNNLDRIYHANNSSKVVVVENLSPSFIDRLNTKIFRLQETTNLSTNFFLFNTNRLNLSARKALSKAIPADLISHYTESLGIPTNQFLAEGVVGFNSNISPTSMNIEEAKQTIEQAGLSGKTIKIMLPQSAEKFVLFLQETYQQLGLIAQIDLYNYAEENLKTRATSYDLIFLGWRNEFGDGQSFFENVAKSSSEFNLGFYSNSQVDQLIQEASASLDNQFRSQKLQAATQILTEENPIGIPLFENKVYYAINKNFTYNDRLDGFIDISSLNQKK